MDDQIALFSLIIDFESGWNARQQVFVLQNKSCFSRRVCLEYGWWCEGWRNARRFAWKR